MKAILVLLLLSLGSPAIAGTSLRELMSFEEYQAHLIKVSQKVDLFTDAWKKDPEALFTGGTTRDYVLWFERQFINCSDRPCVDTVLTKIESQPILEIRSFILEDSDVDVVSKTLNLRARDYGIRKIDTVPEKDFVTGTPEHQSALDQGFIPVERMLLGRSSLKTGPEFGDGLRDLYEGKIGLTLPNPSKFWQTDYAKKFENHPILLIERYIRVVSLYYNSKFEKSDYPEKKNFLVVIPKDLINKITELNASFIDDPKLRECLKNSRFVGFHNKTVEKSFRAYTNPTVTYKLYEILGLDKTLLTLTDIPINAFLFAKPRRPTDLKEFKDRFSKNGFDEKAVLLDTAQEIPGLIIYHGTRSESAFRDILRRGVFESSNGYAGRGLYGVTEADREFSERWGGSKENLIRFEINPKARVVDVSKVPQILLKPFNGDLDQFADYYGIDILFYPYDVRALVVKNAGVLSKAQGVNRKFYSILELLDGINEVKTVEELTAYTDNLALSSKGFTAAERKIIASRIPATLASLLEKQREGTSHQGFLTIYRNFIKSELFGHDERRLLAKSIFKYCDRQDLFKRTQELFKEDIYRSDDERDTYVGLYKANTDLLTKEELHAVNRWLWTRKIYFELNFKTFDDFIIHQKDRLDQSFSSDFLNKEFNDTNSDYLKFHAIRDEYRNTLYFCNEYPKYKDYCKLNLKPLDFMGMSLVSALNPELFFKKYTPEQRLDFLKDNITVFSSNLIFASEHDSMSYKGTKENMNKNMSLIFSLCLGKQGQPQASQQELKDAMTLIYQNNNKLLYEVRKRISKVKSAIKVLRYNKRSYLEGTASLNLVAILPDLVTLFASDHHKAAIIGAIHLSVTALSTWLNCKHLMSEYKEDQRIKNSHLVNLNKLIDSIPDDPSQCAFLLEVDHK